MAEYDGEIRIKTTVDTSGIENEINSQKSSYQELSKERERLIKKQIQLEKEYANIVSQQSSLALQLESQENKILKILDRREAVQDAIASSGGAATDRQIEKLHQYEMDLGLAEKKEALLKSRIEEKNVALQKASENLRNNSTNLENNSASLDKVKNGMQKAFENLQNNSALLDKVKNGMQKYADSLGSIKDKLSSPFESAGKSIGRFGSKIFNLAKSAFIFNIISAGFREMAKASSALIKSDSALSSSLQEIQANLLTAFAPIYNAVLPALRELGKFLSWASLQLATFMSALFGKTLSQSQQSAYDMSKAISSSNSSLKKQSKGLNSVSKSSKKAKNSLASFDKTASKTAKNALASFDKIEVLKKDKGPKTPENKNENNQVSVGINKESFKKVDDEISSFWNGIAERLKAPFQDIDLSNLIDSFERLKGTLSEFGQGTADGLWWIYENILAPFAKWTISEALPRFLDVFNAALKVIQPIAGQVGKDLKFIYDKFLKPAAEWAGDKINDFLDNLKDGLENLANWLNDGDNKPLLEFISKFLIGISAAAVTVGLGKLAVAISTKLVTALLSMNAALLANPWTPVVIGIGLVIAAIIGISEHWDEMKDYFNDAWENAKNIIKGMKQTFNGLKTFFGGWIDFLGGLFSGDWNRMWKGAINIVIGILNTLIGAMNTIGNTVRSVINFIIGGINYGIDSINKIGFKLPDWLGGHEFKLNIPKVYTLPTEHTLIPEIPKLAQGAVLDGSSPFLAWLNDQPKGQTNIETPLNTMVEAFNKAIDNRGMNNNVVIQASGDISQLISYLHFELKKENSRIGDNMISGSVYV